MPTVAGAIWYSNLGRFCRERQMTFPGFTEFVHIKRYGRKPLSICGVFVGTGRGFEINPKGRLCPVCWRVYRSGRKKDVSCERCGTVYEWYEKVKPPLCEYCEHIKSSQYGPTS